MVGILRFKIKVLNYIVRIKVKNRFGIYKILLIWSRLEIVLIYKINRKEASIYYGVLLYEKII